MNKDMEQSITLLSKEYLQAQEEFLEARAKAREAQNEIDAFLHENAQNLLEQDAQAQEELTRASKAAKKAKAALRDKAHINYDINDEKRIWDGAIQVRVTTDDEGHLHFAEGEEDEAVKWAVEKKILTVLRVRKDKYFEGLKSGMHPDMPGSIEYKDDKISIAIYDDKLRGRVLPLEERMEKEGLLKE